MLTGYFSYNNGKIFFELNGEGETIVFVHGFSLNCKMWNSQVSYFSKNYQVLTYDMRGFGRSTLPLSPYSYYDDLRALLEHLGITKVHLVGLSLGGEEALNFVLEYPEYVLSLTLVSSSLGGYSGKVDWDVRASEVGIEQVKQNWLDHVVFRSTKNYPQVQQKLKEMIDDYSGWHWLNSGYRERPRQSAIERLGEIEIPVQIVVGQLDLSYYHEIATILNQKIKGSQNLVFENSGHMLTMEQPDKFNKTLELFLSSIDKK